MEPELGRPFRVKNIAAGPAAFERTRRAADLGALSAQFRGEAADLATVEYARVQDGAHPQTTAQVLEVAGPDGVQGGGENRSRVGGQPLPPGEEGQFVDRLYDLREAFDETELAGRVAVPDGLVLQQAVHEVTERGDLTGLVVETADAALHQAVDHIPRIGPAECAGSDGGDRARTIGDESARVRIHPGRSLSEEKDL
ncbi:hypothetical protein ACIQOW_19030 [Kitasatospora sp. NPDC091335]|uniref:hypothetical protein n=1 Tax=Kitasatospora sp. NPDC091335 TaxID=3364085 RepID=UPI00381BACC8